MSRFLPQIVDAMAEHSMCQPGRPLPQGESQQGSPALLFFHRAKSVWDFFSPWSFVLKSPRMRFEGNVNYNDDDNRNTGYFLMKLDIF